MEEGVKTFMLRGDLSSAERARITHSANSSSTTMALQAEGGGGCGGVIGSDGVSGGAADSRDDDDDDDEAGSDGACDGVVKDDPTTLQPLRLSWLMVAVVAVVVGWLWLGGSGGGSGGGGVGGRPPALISVIIDAGSTGTRLHVYTFSRPQPGGRRMVLQGEEFLSVEPGLSAYANHPEQCRASVRSLIAVARRHVPPTLWSCTPLSLRATAGLRLLAPHTAHALLQQAREELESSPFLVSDVSIMAGSDEALLAWVTINLLTGVLFNAPRGETAGILDLGGGSTQITFWPHSKISSDEPQDFMVEFHLAPTTFNLYCHSYLGLGLMSARLSMLGVEEGAAVEAGRTLHSPCLPSTFSGLWTNNGIEYHASGAAPDECGYESCAGRVRLLLGHSVHRPQELGSHSFYAFSYYYDCAVDSGLVDEELGGSVTVQQFEDKAREVCGAPDDWAEQQPFLCLDLTYISTLLQHGFGFQPDSTLMLSKKVGGVETGWALGAAFRDLAEMQGEQQ
ncbi:LOW QUALITY PROTEIN: nucleoside diphosphate phosphatase ENTPD5-like [Lampetra planeri]